MPEPLERRYRRLLLCYPRAYRRERGADGRDADGRRHQAGSAGGGEPDPPWLAVPARAARQPYGRAWSLLAATICGLFTAAVATWAAWHTGRAQPDRAEAAAILASVLPDHDVGDIYVPERSLPLLRRTDRPEPCRSAALR